MPSIEIKVSYDYTQRVYRADNINGKRLVSWNTDYHLLLLNASGEPLVRDNTKVHVRMQKADGEAETETYTTSDGDVHLWIIADVTAISVSVEYYGVGTHILTEIPAWIRCEESIISDSGIEDEPQPDVYNLAVSFINLSVAGKSAAAAAAMAKLTEIRASAPPAFPGDAYRLAADKTNRVTRITGKITNPDGVEHTIQEEEIVGESLGIQTNCMSADYFLPGGAPSAELRITLRGAAADDYLTEYGSEIELAYHIQRHDEYWCDIPLGVFTAAAREDDEKGVTVTAYDRMMKVSLVPRAALGLDDGWTYQVAEIIAAIAEAAGVEWDEVVPKTPGVILPQFEIKQAGSSIETARDLLSWVAQAINCVAFFDRFGVLRLRLLDTATPVAQFTAQQITSKRISRETYSLKTLESSASFTDETTGENDMEKYAISTPSADGVSANLPENPLWNGIWGHYDLDDKKYATEYQLTGITVGLAPITYKPGEIIITGDPSIDLLDWISVKTTEGAVAYPVTFTDWRYRGDHTLTACGAEAVAGIAKTQAEKAADAYREDSANAQNKRQRDMMRKMTLTEIRVNGHQGMAGYTHEWLSMFKHEELEGTV